MSQHLFARKPLGEIADIELRVGVDSYEYDDGCGAEELEAQASRLEEGN